MDITIEGGRVKNQERRVGFRRGKEGGIDRSKTISSSTLNRSLGYATSFAVPNKFFFLFPLVLDRLKVLVYALRKIELGEIYILKQSS